MRVLSIKKKSLSTSAKLKSAASPILEPMEKRMLMSTTITAWNFDGITPAVNYNPAPSSGAGVASSVGMTSQGNGTGPYPLTTVSGEGPDASIIENDPGSSDTVTTSPENWKIVGTKSGSNVTNGWNYNAPVGAQGAQFNVSTSGYSAIGLQFDWAVSGFTANGQLAVEYTLNDTASPVVWTDAPSIALGSGTNVSGKGDTAVMSNSADANIVSGQYFLDQSNTAQTNDWQNGLTADFSSVSGASNDSNFAVRLVNAATGSADVVSAAGTGLPSQTSANWRFDDVQILGTPIVNVPPAITQSPSSQTINLGNSATFNSAATGSPSPTVQWYESTNGGSTFASISGATSTSYTYTPTAVTGTTPLQFEASYTNVAGTANTSAATLTVVNANPPTITLNPSSQTVTVGAGVTFTAGATATPPVTSEQWFVSTNGGTSFTAIGGATGTSYSLTAAAANNGNQFLESFTNPGGTTNTSAATLTVNFAPTVTIQPSNQDVQAGATAVFTSVVSSNPGPATVQWQVSTDGSSFTNISGATSTTYNSSTGSTTATYSILASTADANTLYRAVFTNSIGNTTTNAASLTVVGEPISQWIFNSNQGLYEVPGASTAAGATNIQDSGLIAFEAGSLDSNGNLDNPDAPITTFSGNPYNTSTGSGDVAQTLGLVNDYQGTPVFSGSDILAVTGKSSINPSFDPYAWRVRSGHTIDGWSQLAPEETTSPDGSLDPQGVLFRVNTTGYSNITLHFQWMGGGIADMQPQYSPDGGTTWKDAGTVLQNFAKDYPGITATTTPPGYYVSLEGAQYADANNNPNFQLRLVAAYDPNLPVITDGNGYEGLTVHGQYASSNAGSQNSQQVLDLGGSPAFGANQYNVSGGNYELSFGGQTTSPIAYNAAPSDVAAALNALSSIGGAGASVSVAQTAITPFTTDSESNALLTITFGGALGNTPVPTITIANNSLTGNSPTVSVATWVPGATAAGVDSNGFETGVTRFQDGNGGWNISQFSFNGLAASGAPTVVTEPANTTVVGGTNATFNASDYSEVTPVTAQWQIYSGSGWSNITGATNYSATTNTSTYIYTTHTNLSDNGYRFRVIFTNADGSSTSQAATVSVVAPVAPSVTSQPVATAVQVGNVATFTSTGTGSPTPSIQWQVNSGSGWTNLTDNGETVTGSTANTLNITAVSGQLGTSYQYRAVFTNVLASTNSNPATLTVLAAETTVTAWTFPSTGQNNTPAPTTGSGYATGIGFVIPYNPNDGASGTGGPGTFTYYYGDVTSSPGAANPGFSENTFRVRGGPTATSGGSPANGWSNYAKEYTQGVQFNSSSAGYSSIYVTMDWYSTTSGELDARQQYTLDGVNWYNLDDNQLAYNGTTNSTTGLDNLDPSDPYAPLQANSNDYYGASAIYGTTTVTSVSRTSNVATLVDNNNYIAGQKVTVSALSGGDSSLNGVYIITAANSTSFSYASTGADIASNTVSGASASLGGFITPLLFNLTGISGASNNANLAVRLVNAYDPSLPTTSTILIGDSSATTHGQYAIASSKGAPTVYPGNAGNWRFGNVSFQGLAATPAWLDPASQASWNPGTKTLTVSGPSTIISNPGTDTPNIVASGSAAVLNVNASIGVVNVGSVSLASGASVNLKSSSNPNVLVIQSGTGNFNVSGGTFDLGNNFIDIQGGSLSTVTSDVTGGELIPGSGLGGLSLGALGAIGAIQNISSTGTALYGTFDGATTSGTGDVLVRYTYLGDANLDGKVDGSDYSNIDSAYLANQTATPVLGWFNGNFNYDSSINGSDYTLIDNAYNTQGSPLVAPAAQIASKVFASGPTISPSASPTDLISTTDSTKKAKNPWASTLIDSVQTTGN